MTTKTPPANGVERPEVGEPRLRMWTLGPIATPGHLPDFGRAAREIEAAGWDGMTVADNQCLWGDTFVALTQAALATDTLLLGTSATNPGTRHPSVLASAAAAVHHLSGGRFRLGVARGDSALAYVGSGPVPVATYQAYLGVVRTLLDGGCVDFEDLAAWRAAPSVLEVSSAQGPTSSRLEWLSPDRPPVPLMAWASGRRAIRAAAAHAGAIMFGLGASVERLQWGIRTAKEACERAGRDPQALTFGTVLHVGLSDDLDYARAMVAPGVAAEVRFSVMTGRITAWVPPEHEDIYRRVAAHYDMNRHGNMTREGTIGEQVALLPADFIDDFAVVGDAATCAARLHELFEIGVHDVLVSQQRTDLAAPDGRDHEMAVATDLLPAVRAL